MTRPRRGVVWLAGFLLLGACTPSVEMPEGVVSAAPRTADFGTVTDAPIPFHRLRVELLNGTPQSYTIRNVDKGEGLRVELASGRLLPAGGRGEVIVTLDARTQTGPYEGEITITWEETAPPLTIPVRAEIEPGAMAEVAGPNIEVVGSAEWAFGTVQRQVVLFHDFIIRNGGTEPLILAKVETRCGCVQAWADERKVMPGERIPIHVRLTPAVYPGNTPRKTITITSNDPDTPVFTLMVHGLVQDTFSIEPSPVEFGEVEPGTSVSRKVVVRANEAGVPRAIGALVDHPHLLRIEHHPEEETDNIVYAATLHLLPDAPLGPFQNSLFLDFPHGADVVAPQIPLSGTVGAPLLIAPTAVNFGLVRPHEVYRRVLHVADVADPQGLEVKTQLTYLTMHVEPEETGLRVELVYAPLQGMGEVTGAVVLQDTATGRVRRVPVVVQFEEASTGQ